MPYTPTISTKRLPTIVIPHGGGPCFFMEWTLGPRETWAPMAEFLGTVPRRYPTARALLVVSGHWEEPVVTVQTAERPPLFYDYYGFPAHTYELTWAAPGEPALAGRVRELLGAAGIATWRFGRMPTTKPSAHAIQPAGLKPARGPLQRPPDNR